MGKKIQCIGKYVMDGVMLGKGNFARVELASHEITAIKVAIKVIDTRKIKEEYIRQNLHREARIMAHLRHPNIIRLYETLKADIALFALFGDNYLRQWEEMGHHHLGAFTEDDYKTFGPVNSYEKCQEASTLYCLVTEYVSGGELLAYIKSQEGSRLTETAARPFIRQLISALRFCHEKNVVHRDLKMENIMLDEKKKNIKLIDFGLSAVWKDDEPLKTHCGSPEYAAPELFVVGKTYGAEIDIWSFGIIMYAMTVGKLPFFTPFKDEYQRQRMLQMIQKGLSSYHDREMQILTPDCRNLLHQLIEPNPKLRIPMSEVEKHPWVTRSGKYPFFPYHPPPKEKFALLRHQAVGELAFMMGLKRNMVEETVKDTKADELSAMFNMMVDQKKIKLGHFDFDHTTRKVPKRDRDSRSRSQERDKVKTPEGVRGKEIRTKGGLKKVPNKSTAGKAGAGSKAKPKNPRYSSLASQTRDGKSVTVSGDRAQIIIDAEMTPEPPALSSPKHKSALNTPGATSLLVPPSGEKETPTANGPTRIPLSQRRQPPPKLNLTLDLSIPHSLPTSSSTTSKRALCITNSAEQNPQKESRKGGHSLKGPHSHQGIEASSGVPPRLSPKDKPPESPKHHTSLIDRLERHLPAPCRPSSFQHTLRSPWHKHTPLHSPAPETSSNTGASDKADSLMQAEKLVAPKATPEDSLIDSYSTSSEEDRNRLCQLLEEREDFDVEDGNEKESMQIKMLNNLTKFDKGHEVRGQGQPDNLGSDISKETLVKDIPESMDGGSCKQFDPHHYLLRNFSTSEQFDSSGSQFSHSSQSGGNIVHYTGSGSSLPADFQQRTGINRTKTDMDIQKSKLLFQPENRSDSAPVEGLHSSKSHKRNPSLSLSLGVTGEQLVVPVQNPCHMCGISPSSPTYLEKHSKFCHTGAHALDVFFSPDELPSPTGVLWRPVASTMQDSPTQGSPEHSSSPLFGSPVPRKTHYDIHMAAVSVESYTDDEFEDDDEDSSHRRPLLSQSHKCHSPSHIQATPAPDPLTANNAKRTAPSKVKSKSANSSSSQSSKNKRLSKNGIHSNIPDTSIRLEPSAGEELTSSSSSSLLQGSADSKCTSTEKLSSSCNAAKIHPLEQPKGEEKSLLRSRIPRPSTGRFARLPVLSLLHSDKHKDKCQSSPESIHDSPKSTPERKSDKDRLLHHHDPKSKHKWRQGLSQLLRFHRSTTNSNNNLAPVHSKKNNNTNSNHKKSGNTNTVSTTGNSVPSRKTSSENNSNHSTPNKSRKNSKETYIQDIETNWMSPPSPVLKCNSLVVPSSPVLLTCPPQTVPLLDVPSSQCLHREAKPRKVGWKGCKECAKSDHSSDEAADLAMEEKPSDNHKEKVLPNSNSIQQRGSHMTSQV